MIDLARLDRVCSLLSAEDASWLRGLIEPRWRRRQRRLDERDELIRELAGPYIVLGSGRATAREVRRAIVSRASPAAVRIIELSAARVPSDRVIRDALSGCGQNSPLSAAHGFSDTTSRSGAMRDAATAQPISPLTRRAGPT